MMLHSSEYLCLMLFFVIERLILAVNQYYGTITAFGAVKNTGCNSSRWKM